MHAPAANTEKSCICKIIASNNMIRPAQSEPSAPSSLRCACTIIATVQHFQLSKVLEFLHNISQRMQILKVVNLLETLNPPNGAPISCACRSPVFPHSLGRTSLAICRTLPLRSAFPAWPRVRCNSPQCVSSDSGVASM